MVPESCQARPELPYLKILSILLILSKMEHKGRATDTLSGITEVR